MRILLLLAAAGNFLAVFAFAAGDVEIPNGDFEDYSGGQFTGWTAVGVTGGNPVLEEFDTWDGYGAFYVDESTSGDHYLQRTISGLIPDETYLLTAKVKTSGVGSNSCGAAVKLGNPIVIGGCDTTQPVTGTREWTLIQVAFRATDDEYQINVGLFGASGEAWFDDVRIVRINGLLKNPDLERGILGVGDNWSPSDWTTGAGNAAYRVGDPLTGTKSLKVEAGGGDNYKYQSFVVRGYDQEGYLKSFHDFVFSGYVKAEGLSGDGVYLRVNKTGTVENHDSDKVSGTKDWTPVSVAFTPEYDYDYETRLVVSGSGTAYFDRVRLDKLVLSDAGFDLGELQDVFDEVPTEGAVPWWQYAGIENVVQIETENGNNFVKLYFNNPAHPPKAYQTVELLKGCDYRITWRGRAGIGAGAYIVVKADTKELYRRGFNTGPSFAEFEDFFYVPPEDVGNSDSIEAEVTLSLTYDDNTASFDDVFIEKVSERQDVNPVTVIPQPQAVMDLGFDTEPIKATAPDAWRIYVTRTGSVMPPPPASWGDIAVRLRGDLASEFDVGPLTWSNLESPVLRPAIVIGDVDGTNQYFLDLIDDLGGVSDYVMSNDEGYEMFVDRDLIVIAAAEPAGAFYGTQTLLHYLKEVPTRYDPEEHLTDRVGYVPCGHIYDWPDMQVRGTVVQIFDQINIGNDYAGYQVNLGKLNLESWKVYRDWIRFLASMKVNALLIAAEYPTLGINPFTEEPYTSTRPGNFPVGNGGIINNRDALAWFFDECRGNFVEPVPEFGPMGHAQSRCLLYEPYAVEARYVGGWPMLLGHEEETVPQPPDVITNVTDGTWHPVSNQWVIKREDADEFGSPTAYFKVEKWEDGHWKPATYLPWNTQGPADLSYEFIDLWFDPDDSQNRIFRLTKDAWEADGAPIPGGEFYNLRFKARDYDEPNGKIKVYYNHVWPYCYKYDDVEGHSKEYYNDFSYCPEDEDVQAFLHDTIDDIFHYLGPVRYYSMFHDEIHRMRTCSKCYDTEIEYHDGKKVTECGVLLADDINRYYDWIEDAADTYQGGLQPYIIIHGDSFIWGHNAISFGPKPGEEFSEYEKKRWEHRNKYRNHFGFVVEEWPDNGKDVNDLGLDSWRWKLGEMPRLVIRPWDYSINMMNVDGGIDVVPKWTMTTYAREVLEGMPVPDYGGYSPPYWPEPYPRYKMLGTPSLAPERFVNYGRGPSKTTDNYGGWAGVYAALRLFNDQDELISATTGIDDSEQESRIKALQAIEGSLWRHVPGYTDEWDIPTGETEQEDWYYVERDFGKLNNPSYYKSESDDSGQIDYATFRVQFDSLVYDKPVTNPANPILFDPGAGGKVWFDDAEFERKIGDLPWDEVLNFDNWYFKDGGTGFDAFEDWTLKAYREGVAQPYPPVEVDEYAETRVFRKPPPGEEWRGYKSCSIDRYKAVKDDMNYYVALEQDVDDFGLYDFDNTKFRVGLRVRSKYVDTYRLAGVWQWQYMLDRYDYNKYDPDRERALGIILHNGFQRVFYNRPNDLAEAEEPGDWPDGDNLEYYKFANRHGYHFSVNGRACDAAVAEWCWSLNKPRKWDNPASITTDEGIYDTPKLENLWYCPYYIHQRERTWFEKK